MKPDLTLITLGCAGLAAAVSAVGALPFAFGWHPRTAVGAAYALPGGVMLGAAYLLGTRSLDRSIPLAGLGVALGLAFIYWTARFTETSDEEESPDPAAGYRHLLRDSLHSASEG
ncbi:MAG: hypothetical protein KDD47_21140, partial [Acidobacteria bacterium]|nr:hypothetical protein [Acidobacteriota bacterium]